MPKSTPAPAGGDTEARYRNLNEYAWQAGFSVFSVSESPVDSVVAYIQNQENHHRTVSLAEELEALLKKHGVRFDQDHMMD